jgi:hypothetical protein
LRQATSILNLLEFLFVRESLKFMILETLSWIERGGQAQSPSP